MEICKGLERTVEGGGGWGGGGGGVTDFDFFFLVILSQYDWFIESESS